ncbi:MAG: hypothetical protein B6I18_01010 [Bacteroidetes bacterium 4572_112]|nr:MAG: hypothetical protein B6I18_01010 [Bacteroidetes bacterium 4572_112]
MLIALIIVSIILLLISYKYYEINKSTQETLLLLDQKQKDVDALKQEIESFDFENQTVNMALSIIQKNEMLEKIRRKITKYSSQYEFQSCTRELIELDLLVFETLQLDKDRDTLKLFIEKSNRDFYSKLNSKFPNLTNNEQRLCTLLRLNLSSKEIANIQNITEKSVEMNRYRLRKKIQIPSSESLTEYIKSI